MDANFERYLVLSQISEFLFRNEVTVKLISDVLHETERLKAIEKATCQPDRINKYKRILEVYHKLSELQKDFVEYCEGALQ